MAHKTDTPRKKRGFLRLWAVWASLPLAALLGWSVYDMVEAGWPKALRQAPQVLLCLLLIAGVWVVRLKGASLWRKLLGSAGRTLGSQGREEVIETARERATHTLQQGKEQARGMFDRVGDKAGEGWQKLSNGLTPGQVSRPAARAAPTRRTCPACGAACSATASFCPACGQVLAETCPSCGRSLRPEMTFCDNCGRPLQGGVADAGRAAGKRKSKR